MPRTKEKESYRARLKAVGLRHTLPRERILSFLDRKNVHPTPEELWSQTFAVANAWQQGEGQPASSAVR